MVDKRTKIIGIRVTEEEMKKLEAIAESNNKKVSEWCYHTISKALEKHTNPQLNLLNLGEKIILEELVSLKSILLNSLVDKQLTEDKLKKIINKTNTIKGEKAQQLITEFISDTKPKK